MTNTNPRRLFYVVKFIELPFEKIDDYICVPKSWLILQTSSNQKVFIAYPNTEDRFDTRDRVKRKEEPNDKWGYYMATIEYESGKSSIIISKRFILCSVLEASKMIVGQFYICM